MKEWKSKKSEKKSEKSEEWEWFYDLWNKIKSFIELKRRKFVSEFANKN